MIYKNIEIYKSYSKEILLAVFGATRFPMVLYLCAAERYAYKYEKIISILLASAIVLSLLTVSGFAATTVASGKCGSNVSWTLNSDGLLTISGTGAMEDYQFNAPWLDHCNAIKNVNIKGGVTRIGKDAFNGCFSLTSVVIPSSVTSIGDNAFSECYNLISINIPNGVTRIGDYTFSGCDSLTSISIPASVTSIGNSAFADCLSLTGLKLPDKVTSIGDSAFSGCSSLTNINIPNGVTSIGLCVFNGCASLTSINIPASVTSIGDTAFADCRSLTSINIPASVTSIEGFAFSGCSSLTNVNIPNGVTSIGAYTFSNCASLTSIHIPDSVTSIGGQAFSHCSKLSALVLPANVTSIGDNAFWYCENLSRITIPDKVTSIGESAFHNCSSLDAVYYYGSEEQWEKISILDGNEALTDTKIHYNVAFGDVFETDWYYDDVMFVYDNGLMNGTSDRVFNPQRTTTRGMILTILHRLEGAPAVDNAPSFTDVPAEAWFTDAVTWGSANGIVNGYGNGTFDPNRLITREQMAAILWRYASYKGFDVSSGEGVNLDDYADGDSISGYARQAMQWAIAEGLLKGYNDNTLKPLGNAKRCEAAAILHRFYTLMEE